MRKEYFTSFLKNLPRINSCHAPLSKYNVENDPFMRQREEQ
jgi:hypothetical protein